MFKPCIDIHNGIVKQIIGKTLMNKDEHVKDKHGKDEKIIVNFISMDSAEHFALLYKTNNLFGGHVIMLDRKDETIEAALSALRAFPFGLQVGGGMNPKNYIKYIEAGASHIIATSYLFTDGNLDMDKVREMSSVVGADRLVIDLSCRNKEKDSDEYFVVMNKWRDFTTCKVDKSTMCTLSKYCSEFLIHGIDVEGTCLGVDERLVNLISRVSPISVTYAGGVHSLEEYKKVVKIGGGKISVTIGSALDIFGGTVPFLDVVQFHNNVQWS